MIAIRKSLSAKVTLLVTLIGVAVFAAVTLIGTMQMRKTMTKQMQQSVKRSVALMSRSIEKPMVVGDNESTIKEFKALATEYPDTRTYMTNYKGNVTYTTDENALRQDFKGLLGSPVLDQALDSALAEERLLVEQVQLDGSNYMAEIKSVPNSPSCHHCHGASEPVLGALVSLKDVNKEMAAIASQTRTSIELSVAGLVVMLAGIILFMRRAVIRHVTKLAGSAQRVSNGDYSVQFAVPSQDELRTLGDSLRSMVGDLKNKLGFSEGVLNGISAPCGIVGPDLNMLWANKHMLELLERTESPEQIAGMKDGEFYWRDPSRETLSARAFKEQTVLQHDIEFPAPSGTKYVTITATPFYDMDGELLGAVSFWHDLTEIRLQQMQIAEQNERMGVVADQAMEIAARLASSSEELASQVDTANHGAQRQSDRAQETATAMEEMNVTVLEVARNSSHAAEVANQARDRAIQGEQIVEEAIAAINVVHNEAETMKQNIHQLGEQAQDVGRIMGVISDIADQTNLLALNAAIEAARAGDAGRGFAVVADEVRKLAERTMEATQEVAQAVTSIQSGVSVNITGVDKAAGAVEESTTKANMSGEALREIVGLIESAADEVRAIATAAEQQSATSEEINQSTVEINEIAGETSKIMGESAQAVAEVSEQATELSRLIDKIKQ